MKNYLAKYNVVIQGTSPILLHKYVVSSVSTPETSIGKGNASLQYKDEWKKGTYLNPQGNVVMPSTNILACIYNGSKGIRKGKYYLSRLIYPSLIIQPFEPVIKVDNKTITLDDIEKNNWLNVMRAVVMMKGIDRIRTELPIEWTIEFELFLTNDQLNEKDVKEILENAGYVAGLGDMRPSSPKKPGPYGRFEVISFESV